MPRTDNGAGGRAPRKNKKPLTQIPSRTRGQSENRPLAAEKKWTLTHREEEVMDLARLGKPNREIGRDLRACPRTIGKHLESIYGKLGVKNRGAAVHKYDERILRELKAEIEELRALVLKLRRRLAPPR